jgi:hypothetical protein
MDAAAVPAVEAPAAAARAPRRWRRGGTRPPRRPGGRLPPPTPTPGHPLAGADQTSRPTSTASRDAGEGYGRRRGSRRAWTSWGRASSPPGRPQPLGQRCALPTPPTAPTTARHRERGRATHRVAGGGRPEAQAVDAASAAPSPPRPRQRPTPTSPFSGTQVGARPGRPWRPQPLRATRAAGTLDPQPSRAPRRPPTPSTTACLVSGPTAPPPAASPDRPRRHQPPSATRPRQPPKGARGGASGRGSRSEEASRRAPDPSDRRGR